MTVNSLGEAAWVCLCSVTNNPKCQWVDLLCEGHQSVWDALFATSLRDYLGACRTACNLAAHGDRDSASPQCCEEQACSLDKSLSLENQHAHTDMQMHTGTKACTHTDTGKFCLESCCIDCGAHLAQLDCSIELSTYVRSLVHNRFNFSL